MEMQEIEVTIDKNGQTQIHVMGIKGKACLEITRELEKILGGNLVEQELTSEALEEENVGLSNKLEIKNT